MKGILSSVAVAASVASILVMAAPTVQVKGGRTSLGFSGEIQDSLVSAGCAIDRVKPASLKPGGDRVRFPIGGGALDLGSLLGEVEHRGGLVISCEDALDPNDISVVTLENLRIEALDPNSIQDPNDPTVITALASVDDNLFDRIELLLPGDSGIAVSGNGNKLVLRGDGLTLAPEAAEFLNAYLGIEVPSGLVVGDAVSQVNIRAEKSDDSDHPGKGKGKEKNSDKGKGKDKDKDEEDDEDEDDD